MGFLSRRKNQSPVRTQLVPGHDDLVMIPDAEIEPVINGLTDIVVEQMGDFPFTQEKLGLLQVGLPYLTQSACSDDAIVAGQTAARLGYLSRSAEFAKFEAAQEADLGLSEAFSAKLETVSDGGSVGDAAAEFAAAMVLSEPVDPSPDEGGPSWALPGLGGSVRATLRDHLLSGLDHPPDLPSDDLKRAWKYGYFLRALEEFFFEEGMQR